MESKYYILNEQEYKNLYADSSVERSPFDIGIPLLDISDETIQQIYYFRWHTYCKHIKETPAGYVVTEFKPDVWWAGIYNTISCPIGHHFYEGRWLHDKKYINDYARFWFTDGAEPRRYSTWIGDALYALCMVSGEFEIVEGLYDGLKANYEEWEKSNLHDNGMFRQIDDRDGMEYSISGNGCRPTINSYMYGDAAALSKIAKRLGNDTEADFYDAKATLLRNLINNMLWDENAVFYKNLAEKDGYKLADVREQIGYIPWYFNIPQESMSEAWKFLNDENYFAAPYGPTTAERNHPEFMKSFDHECLWNGPSWPFATTQTLVAMANLLNNYNQEYISKDDYFNLLKTYSKCHYLTEDEKTVPFIDEDLDPFTGEWIARKILIETEPDPVYAHRGKDYNHSGYCDLVLSGLAGVRPREDDVLEINPMFEADNLTYMCADGIMYHGHNICIMWDKTGDRYGKGAGFHVYVDGQELVCKQTPEKIEIKL